MDIAFHERFYTIRLINRFMSSPKNNVIIEWSWYKDPFSTNITVQTQKIVSLIGGLVEAYFKQDKEENKYSTHEMIIFLQLQIFNISWRRVTFIIFLEFY